MSRRRLWEIGCVGIDAVLCTSFDPDELLGMDPAMRGACEIPELPGFRVPRSLIVDGVAHKACHSENPTSLRIERRLDAMHRRLLDESQTADQVDVLARCDAVSDEADEDLAGCLGTVLTDSRSELRQQGPFWVQGVMIRSLLPWMESWRQGRRKRSDAGHLGQDFCGERNG
jgi:hypothetical protein